VRIPRDRPVCFLNAAVSLDGKIASARRELPTFPSGYDRRMMDRIRARADAILVGAGTLRAADFPLRIRSPRLRRQRRAAGKSDQPLNILLSTSLRLPLSGRFFCDPSVARLVVTGSAAPARRIAAVRKRAEVIRLPGRRVSPRRLLRTLRRRGIRQLLLEGGGRTNFEFFREGCIDEVFLTLCPVVIGGRSSPTPVDGDGFHPDHFPGFRLLQVRRRGGELYLHYLLDSRSDDPRRRS
jgi:2,5-diamino-6-(ribosylamino)-4(3H)-pyrimidinone 5'-phosphate reductase